MKVGPLPPLCDTFNINFLMKSDSATRQARLPLPPSVPLTWSESLRRMTSALMRLSLSLSVGTAMLARRPRLKLSTTLMPIPPPPPAPAVVMLTPATWLVVAAEADGGQLALYRLTLFTVKIPIRK